MPRRSVIAGLLLVFGTILVSGARGQETDGTTQPPADLPVPRDPPGGTPRDPATPANPNTPPTPATNTPPTNAPPSATSTAETSASDFNQPNPFQRNAFQDWLSGPQSVRDRAGSRLSSAPDMFGDCIAPGTVSVFGATDDVFEIVPDVFGYDDEGNLIVISEGGTVLVSEGEEFEIALARIPFSVSGALKVAENGRAEVANRFLFDVRSFRDPLAVFPDEPNHASQHAFQRYTLQFEKVIDEAGSRSIGLRLPVVGGSDVGPDGSLGAVGFDLDGIQTIGLQFKQELLRTENCVTSLGVMCGIPVGHATELPDPFTATEFQVRHDTFHVLPWIGVLATPTDRLFLQGFVQIDTPTGGNPIDATHGGVRTRFGRLRPRTLVYVDVGGGVWLYRRSGIPGRRTRGLTGIAAIAELHFTHALGEGGFVTGEISSIESAGFGNTGDYQILNMTTGLQFQCGENTAIRLGLAFPTTECFNRPFDSELIGTIVHRF